MYVNYTEFIYAALMYICLRMTKRGYKMSEISTLEETVLFSTGID